MSAREDAEVVAKALEPVFVALTALRADTAAQLVNHAMGFIRGQGTRIDNLREGLERIERRLIRPTSDRDTTPP